MSRGPRPDGSGERPRHCWIRVCADFRADHCRRYNGSLRSGRWPQPPSSRPLIAGPTRRSTTPAPSRRSAGVRHGDELTLTTNILMQLAVRTRGSTNSRRTSGYGRNSSPGQRVQTAIGSADSIQDGRLRHRRFGHTRPDAGTHTSMRCRRGGRADVAQRRGHVGAADCLGRGEAARQRSDQRDARAFPWKRRSSLRVRSTRKADLCG